MNCIINHINVLTTTIVSIMIHGTGVANKSLSHFSLPNNMGGG